MKVGGAQKPAGSTAAAKPKPRGVADPPPRPFTPRPPSRLWSLAAPARHLDAVPLSALTSARRA